MFPRAPVLTAAIRRDILAVLAESDAMTVPAATAEIAAEWSARRRRLGDSPLSLRGASSLVFQVGAELFDDVAARPVVTISDRRGGSPGHPGTEA